ncbi:hypothetical protein HUT16_21690 [Kitasatospora sp. NA04385]|uniref:hypothetical protein n=1 Tax=Kitasatospora sp. NA04385 TaxID=2742135 RepID=UPI0015926725|nr:hypothetical protein [Kitasatospora sp. NA04385]QKW21326.1 hypothetical protein HUT16_21690 [Kitasatospora sp. NA04385]
MARLIVIIPLVLLLAWKVLTWWAKAKTARVEKLQGELQERVKARRAELERELSTEHGLVPREELVVTKTPEVPGLDAALAAATAGDWHPAAELLAAATGDHDLRLRLLGPLGENAAEDDAWLRAWRAERPEDADAAVITVEALVQLAWNIRSSRRASEVSQEQFQAFHRVLGEAEEAAKDAERLAADDDPLPFYVQQPVAMGLSWANSRYVALWSELSARDPRHLAGHQRALQYWCAKWHGSHELMHAFADAAVAGAPVGSLLTAVKLQAWDEQFRGAEDRSAAYGSPEVLASVEAAEADLAAAEAAPAAAATAPRIRYLHGLLAEFHTRAGRGADAMRHFRALGPHVPGPWTDYEDPVGAIQRDRVIAAAHLAGGTA